LTFGSFKKEQAIFEAKDRFDRHSHLLVPIRGDTSLKPSRTLVSVLCLFTGINSDSLVVSQFYFEQWFCIFKIIQEIPLELKPRIIEIA